MEFYLHQQIKKYFSTTLPPFEQLMALRGECFRHQKGRMTQRIQLGDKTYFIKQHNGVGLKEIFKNIVQLRWPVVSAKNEWHAIEKLRALNVPVPSVLAYGQRGVNPAHRQSFILMEELKPIISLEELCQTWHTSPPPFAFKRKLIEEVARIARVLHQNGLNHRDFYICHFLLDVSQGLKNASVNQPKLYLIDLHRAQSRLKTPLRWIIKDLASLLFSSKEIGLTQRDKYRFMKIYHGQSLRDILRSNGEFWQKVKIRGCTYRDHAR